MTRILLALLLSLAPALAQERQVQGITAPVEIITDRWGIPHINASSHEDAFFGQGYAAATARLWQLDLTRRRQLGRLAEAFGPGFLPFDEAARHVVFRGDVAAEWPRQSPRAHALALAWVAGINARVAEVLASLPEPPAEAALLRGWDGRLDAESEAASLYQLWWSELAAALRLAVVPEAARGAIAALHPHVVLALAARAEHRDLAVEALQRAAARLRALPEDGRAWGARHRVDLRHPMSALVANANVLGGRSGGDGATVMARWWANGQNPVVTGGASFRVVLDIGNWDAARGINLPGQSGDPRDGHYRDLYPLWVAGEMVPLAYSASAVAAVAESRVRLVPR